MGLPYIQVEPSLLKHPRLLKTARELGIAKIAALGHIVATWMAAAELYESGDLGVVSDFEIEAWAEWQGEAGAFAKAFRANWMDGDALHGWKERYEKILKRRKTDRRRWKKRADSMNAQRRKTSDEKKKRLGNVAERSGAAPLTLRSSTGVKGKGKGKGKGTRSKGKGKGMGCPTDPVPVPVPSSAEDPSSHPPPPPVEAARFDAFWESSRVAAHRWRLILEALGPDLSRFAAEVAADVLAESGDRRNPQSYATRIIRTPKWLRERAARLEAARADEAEASSKEQRGEVAAVPASSARSPPKRKGGAEPIDAIVGRLMS